MINTSRLLATACSVAAIALAQAAMSASTAPRTSGSNANPTAGLDTGTSCDQLTGKDRETCLQNLPNPKAKRGSSSMRERSEGASTGSSARSRACEQLTGDQRQRCLQNLPPSNR